MLKLDQLESVYSEEEGEIQIDRLVHYLQVNWRRHTEEAEFRNFINLAKGLARDHNLHYWLCNMQQLHYMLLVDQNWLVNEVFPVFAEGPKLRFAYVINQTGLEAMSAFRIHQLVQQDTSLSQRMEIDVFQQVSHAQSWLA